MLHWAELGVESYSSKQQPMLERSEANPKAVARAHLLPGCFRECGSVWENYHHPKSYSGVRGRADHRACLLGLRACHDVICMPISLSEKEENLYSKYCFSPSHLIFCTYGGSIHTV